MPVNKRLSLIKGTAIRILVVAFVICALVFLNRQSQVLRFFEWLDKIGAWAPPLFILIDMLVVVFILPGVIFTLGAGFMFGVLKGSLYVVIGTTLGATIAFIIARYLFGERASRFVLAHSKLTLVDDAFKREGLKIVLLTRLVPFFPFKLSNYFFGLMPVSLRDFFLGVLLGIVPFTVTNVYIGSLSAHLATLGLRSASRSKAEWAIYVIGFIITIGVLIYFSRIARKALDNYSSKGKIRSRGE